MLDSDFYQARIKLNHLILFGEDKLPPLVKKELEEIRDLLIKTDKKINDAKRALHDL